MKRVAVAGKAIGQVTPGQPLNTLPRPRILVRDPRSTYWGSGGMRYMPGPYDAEEVADRLRTTIPAVVVAANLDDFNLNEWDCIVTTSPPVYLESEQTESDRIHQEPQVRHTWSQRYPRHLSVICMYRSGSLELLDAYPPEGKDEPDLPEVAIIRDPDTVGSHLRQVNGLPERLSSVVRQELLPVARGRQKHPSIRHWKGEQVEPGNEQRLTIRPFMLGPDDVVLAGSYERNDQASVWLLPNDLPDLYPWIIEALREWNALYPGRFPRAPDWHDSDDWRTTTELAISAERQELAAEFAVHVEKYRRNVAELDARAEKARAEADAYQRALLAQDGDELAEAVACALAALGFHVVDMDEHWPPGDRREDLRVFDDDDPNWVAIVEVKGAIKGAKETEVQNFGRWAERFILDERREPDARWFVTNHERGADPTSRQEPFRNKPAVITTFAKSKGTVIDTRALFDLLRLVEGRPERAAAARGLLRASPPVLVRVTVDDLEPTEPPDPTQEAAP